MTPEETFNEQVWEILQEIREESFATLTGEPIKYLFPHIQGVGVIENHRRKRIIFKLEELGAYKIHRNAEGTRIGSDDTYYLIVNQPQFDELYSKYEKLGKKSTQENQKESEEKQKEIESSNYRDITAKIVVSDLQSKYQEIEHETNQVQFFIKIAHYGHYILENAASIYVLEGLYQEAKNDAKPYRKAWEQFFKDWQYYAQDILVQAEKAGIKDDPDNPLSDEINRIRNKLDMSESSFYESDISNYYVNYWYLVRRFADLKKSDLLIPKHFESIESPMKISKSYDNATYEWTKFKNSREAKVWWAHYQISRLAAGILDLKQKESYFNDDNAIDGFYRFEFNELARGNRLSTPIVLHEHKYKVWIKRLHEYLIPRLDNVDMNWVIADFRAKYLMQKNTPSQTDSNIWSENFKWLNDKEFSLGEGHTVKFSGSNSDRLIVFRMLTEAEGNWVKVDDMAKKINKVHGRTRTIIAQLNIDKLEKEGIISIVPKSNTNEPGAYKISLVK